MTELGALAAAPRIRVILWEDIFVVVDDGSGEPRDYDELRRRVVVQSALYPRGLGCLAIIPAHARPPSEDARRALNATLESIPLQCICWCVEGSGFQSAMVRAVLSGLRFFYRRPYATHIASNLDDAVAWILPFLGSPKWRHSREGAAAIREQRDSDRFTGSPLRS